MSKVISRDPFARVELIREIVHLGELTGPTCEWCGCAGKFNKSGRTLFRYSYEDDSGRRHFNEKLFCCVSCFRAYTE